MNWKRLSGNFHHKRRSTHSGETLSGASSSEGSALSMYLKETQFCDYNHPIVQEILHGVTDGCKDEGEKARRIFYFIRDNIRFAVMGSGVGTTASRTTRIGYGDCGTKTNVHISLLRGAGIPARMRAIMADVSVLKGIMPGFMYYVGEKFSKEDFHFWPECYLSGKWIACEGLLDKKLYEGVLKNGLLTKEQIPGIDWDGETDLVLLEGWKTEDLGYKPSWDDWYVEFKKKMSTPRIIDRLMELTVAPLSRRKTDRVRKQG